MNKNDFKIETVDNLIVSCLSGSHAYGMNTPSSDVDVRGIFCADAINIRTPWFPYREQTIEEQEDAKLYELTNFMKLYLDCNPNIVETLWVDDESIIQSSEAYDHLRKYRQELLSSKVAFTFSGYAHSQLLRIKGHKKWINNPCPKEPPRQTDYVKMVQNFTTGKILPKDFHLEKYREGRLIPFGNNIYGLYLEGVSQKARGYKTFDNKYTLNTIFDDESRYEWGAPQILVRFDKENYLKDKDTWKNYWRWKKNRNEVRAKMEEESGFDRKHASHLVRLLTMCEEILTTGEVLVKRPDAQELLGIRNGERSYDDIVSWAESKDKYIKDVLYKNTLLPKKPNVKLAAKVLMEVQDMYW